MSRAFNGGTSLDMLTFGVGAAPPDQGPITMAILAKASGVATSTSYMVQGVASTTPVFSALFSNNAGAKLFMESDFGNGVGGISATDWLWYVGTKASGSALPRWHVKNLTTNAAWAHTNGSATVGDGSGPITAVRVGSNNAMATTFRGSIAVVALWDTALSDVDVELACTYAYADAVVTKAAKWAVALNQASTATSVNNDAAGGGNQTAISGTTVDASDPPGFSYSLSSTVNGTSSATGAGIATASAAQRAGSSATGAGAATGSAVQRATASAASAGAATAAGRQQAGSTATAVGTATATATQLAGSTAVGAGAATGSAGGTVTGTSSAAGAGAAVATAAQSAGSSAAGTSSATGLATLRPTSTATGTGSASASAVQVATGTAIASGAATGNAGGAVQGTSSATGLGVASATAVQRGSSTAAGAGLASGAVRISATSASVAAGVASGTSRLVIFGTSTAIGLGIATGTAGSRTTPRPFVGVTSRPSGGTTSRPFAGVTARP
jgi:hypothetical protein